MFFSQATIGKFDKFGKMVKNDPRAKTNIFNFFKFFFCTFPFYFVSLKSLEWTIAGFNDTEL